MNKLTQSVLKFDSKQNVNLNLICYGLVAMFYTYINKQKRFHVVTTELFYDYLSVFKLFIIRIFSHIPDILITFVKSIFVDSVKHRSNGSVKLFIRSVHFLGAQYNLIPQYGLHFR